MNSFHINAMMNCVQELNKTIAENKPLLDEELDV